MFTKIIIFVVTLLTITGLSIATNTVNACNLQNPLMPGDAQLKAIKLKFADATAKNLSDGYALFTSITCTRCHKPKDIYKRTEEKLIKSMDKMAIKAKLTTEQKDAVLKYVLAMKATQPVESK